MINLKYLLILLFIVSCREDRPEKTEQEQIDERAKIIYDSTLAEERKSFFEKYKPSSISDSTFKFTYQLQESINNTNSYFKLTGKIIDIIKKGEVYVLKIRGEFADEITFLELNVAEDLLEKIEESWNKDENYMEAEFVFELIDFSASTGFRALPFDSDNSDFDIKYDFKSVTYFIRGNLVDLLPLD